MDYIVLDMEWNQPWPGSPSARKILPVQIRGEIIQMGQGWFHSISNTM